MASVPTAKYFEINKVLLIRDQDITITACRLDKVNLDDAIKRFGFKVKKRGGWVDTGCAIETTLVYA